MGAKRWITVLHITILHVIASNTPELWSFWGNNLQDWKKRYHRSGGGPVDLVLNVSRARLDSFTLIDEPLQDAIRNRVSRDAVRQVHIWGRNGSLNPLSSIISLLTPDGEGVRYSSIESIDLRLEESSALDLSDFFVRRRLPKLRHLFLRGILTTPSWDNFVPYTTLLTSLSLDIKEPWASRPTTSQLLSALVSNPNLQDILLTSFVIPEDDGGGPNFQVPLRRLRNLCLVGEIRRLFRLLDRLSFPGTLDSMSLTALYPVVEDVLRISGPYLRGYFRRDRWLQGRLGISPGYSVSEQGSLMDGCFICVDILGEHRGGSTFQSSAVATFRVALTEAVHLRNLSLDLNRFIPGERAGRFETNISANPDGMEDLLIAMPNIETLILSNVILSNRFLQPDPNGPRANTKLLPSLQSLYLRNIVSLSDDNWGHLITYLAHQISGGRAISLEIGNCLPHMCPEAAEEIMDLVGEFGYRDWGARCPFGRCERKVARPWFVNSRYMLY